MGAHTYRPMAARAGRRLRAAAASAFGVLAAGTVIAGCSADPSGFNDADVAFASDMTQHHAQTVHLVNLALRHRVSSGDVAWTDSVRARRFTELQAFRRLLRSWDQKIPVTGLDHSDEGEHISVDTRIPGVVNEQRMRVLQNGTDQAFIRSWLTELIRHEQGAVQMAAEEVAAGQNAKAMTMARKDKKAHAELVADLRRLAGS